MRSNSVNGPTGNSYFCFTLALKQNTGSLYVSFRWFSNSSFVHSNLPLLLSENRPFANLYGSLMNPCLTFFFFCLRLGLRSLIKTLCRLFTCSYRTFRPYFSCSLAFSRRVLSLFFSFLNSLTLFFLLDGPPLFFS